MKKVVVSLLTIALASFLYFFNPDFSFAAGQYNCSEPGKSCQGVELQPGMYNNGTNLLWVDAGTEIYYAVDNFSSDLSKHTIDYFVTGPNGWKSYTHTAAPGDTTVFSSVAPYSGYYQLHLECAYQQANDCDGMGDIYHY